MASVATSGVTVRKPTTRPLTSPTSSATASTTSTAGSSLSPWLAAYSLTARPDSVIIPGTERSMPRCMITSVWPTAAMARIRRTAASR